MKISVVITTYNRPIFFNKAYESVLNQSVKPYEIIIINNGKVNYLNKDFEKKKIKLRIFNNKKNLFIAKARNKGAKNSKGEYIAFLDDDDLWEKNYLKEAKKILKDKKVDIILSKIYTNKDKKLKLFKDPNNVNLQSLLIGNSGVTGSNIIIKKKKFNKVGGYKKELEPSEDKAIVVEAILKRTKIVCSNKKVYFSLHQQKRLTSNYKKLSEGMRNFYIKYKYLMNISQRIYVKNKIYFNKLKSGNLSIFFITIIYFLLNKIFN